MDSNHANLLKTGMNTTIPKFLIQSGLCKLTEHFRNIDVGILE